MDTDKLLLLTTDEQRRRVARVRSVLDSSGIDSALISSNANIYYLTGRVFSGYVVLPAGDADPVYMVKRPVHLDGDGVIMIRKPENIVDELNRRGLSLGAATALELGRLSYNMAIRLNRALGNVMADAGPALDAARSVKTDYELRMLSISARKHEYVYSQIPSLYRPGMSDVELQVEIERLSRLEGCLGQFRIAGEDMELYMGNVLAGDNADAPSPYDFAMGGAGIDPSLPVGADGTILRRGMVVMVDMNGNYTGYMTDMTRCYVLGEPSPEVMAAHKLSVDICRAISQAGVPGVQAKDLYQLAVHMSRQAGMEHLFMGHRQHAGFVGHGIGIEVNEQPVLAPRSKSVLQPGNVIAVEPKFVLPGAGAVGIENTYVVSQDGPMRCLTNAPEQLIRLD